MKRAITWWMVVFSVAALAAEPVRDSEVDAAPVVSVGLFKNGFALVTRRVTPNADGIAWVRPAGQPSYGTFWYSSTDPLRITSEVIRLRREDAPKFSEWTEWAETFGGRNAEVTFRAAAALSATLEAAARSAGCRVRVCSYAEETIFSLSGYVLPPAAERRAQPRPSNQMWGARYASPISVAEKESLTLRLASGSTVVIPSDNIVAVQTKEGEAIPTPVWKFEGSTRPFTIQYLTSGAMWTPSYRLDLSGGKGQLTMGTELRNEIVDWKEVEVSLISGFPNIRYADVPSLLGAGVKLNQYRDMVTYAEDGSSDPWSQRRRRGVMGQSVMLNSAGESDFDVATSGYAATAIGSGSDIHYRSIGKVSLAQNSVCSIPLGSGETEVKRIVDWDVNDTRDQDGRFQSNPDGGKGAVLWDAVRFRNSFSFPMTTAPIEVTENGRILGQTRSDWTNPGDIARVRITHALSVKGSYAETGDGKTISSKIASLQQGERFDFDHRHYRKEIVAGKFTVQNFRAESASLTIRKTISGEIIETSIQPTKNVTPPPTDNRVNLVRQLTWEFDLNPGEKREFTLTYWLWVLI